MSLFNIESHVIQAAHLHTEFPRATTSAYVAPPDLKLAVKQYTPLSAASNRPQPGDVTIVFCHANGFHKELYEPFFDELLAECQRSGIRVRSIWAPDAAHQGASGVLNESVLGDDPCWNDLPRDLLHMVNTFRDKMVPPIIGMGHSYGGHAIARTALIHPSLFAALVLIDPVLHDDESSDPGRHPARLSARRRDVWGSQAEAEKYFASRPFYKRWDPRVLKLHMEYGLRPLPTLTYPDGVGVTLATTKAQEVYTFLHIDPKVNSKSQLRRPEPPQTFGALGCLVPPVLYVVGGKSNVSTPAANERKMLHTPNAEIVAVEDAGHLVPQEEPIRTALATVPYIARQIDAWKTRAVEDQKTPRSNSLSDDFLVRLEKL